MRITSPMLCLFLLMPVLAFGRAEFKIVTASERGTYIQIGRDLAKWVADPAGVDLEVLPSKGLRLNSGNRFRYARNSRPRRNMRRPGIMHVP